MSIPNRPYSIRIFVPEGRPEGLRLIEKSNWTGLGVVFPRSDFRTVRDRKEFDATGIYILVGPSESGDLRTLYVGQGDPVKRRLEDHYAKKDFWTWAAFFVTKDDSLNKAHIGQLEARLIELAKKARRRRLDNNNTPSPSPLSEAETADMESFLSDILSILPLVGLNGFETPSDLPIDREVLNLNARGVTARGYESRDGFTVMAGSQSHAEETNVIHQYPVRMRHELRADGILMHQETGWTFTEDYTFSSPSTAAGVVLGRNQNGREAWKTAEGITLKELQQRAVERH